LKFKNKTVLILGGNSDVGKFLAISFAKLESNLILTTRVKNQLESFSSDLEIRYSIQCKIVSFDVLNFSSHSPFYQNLDISPDIVISCVGYLDDQAFSERNFDEAIKSINSNYVGLVSIFNIIAKDFEKINNGIIVGISSVAGDRGRGSNFIYGSSKSALSCYLSGLRNRLAKSNVHVMTVKPGFINTKMTEHLNLPPFLTAEPELISKNIIRAIEKKKNIIYTTKIWFFIMLIIKLIPEFFFKKLKL
tara:strand:+ start:3297 stop:4040 length:744 start_codon:yes stop_codon:yes gene_type:complete